MFLKLCDSGSTLSLSLQIKEKANFLVTNLQEVNLDVSRLYNDAPHSSQLVHGSDALGFINGSTDSPTDLLQIMSFPYTREFKMEEGHLL